jgi:hypothetical protein
MLSVEPECSIVVIKFRCFPAAGIVTGKTIGFPSGCKLAKVNIIMTIGALNRQTCEFLSDDTVIALSEMAGTAFLNCMSPGEVKICPCMIERHFGPAVD